MARLDDAQIVLDSRLLYGLCCDVGFSRRHWRRTVRDCDMANTLNSYGYRFANPVSMNIQYSGSYAEGVAAAFLGSDTDIMMVISGSRVIEDDRFCPDDPDIIYQSVLSHHPAFVRLKLLHIGATTGDRTLPTHRFCEIDATGTFVLNGRKMITATLLGSPDRSETVRMRGPAQTTSFQINPHNKYDFVLSLHCRAWPSAANEWIYRNRHCGWPTLDLISNVLEQGCELVAVGNPESEHRELEWRLSSSLAEIILIRSLNIVQIQCYFLLKMILAFLIKPRLGDYLCSYHMKTIILHTVENTDPQEWKKDNITHCFMKCLNMLLRFLQIGYLPQFFILGHNLFRPKIQGETRRKLQTIVDELHSEGWRCLLRCVLFTKTDISCSHQALRCPCFIQKRRFASFLTSANAFAHTIRFLPKSAIAILQTFKTDEVRTTIRTLLKVTAFDESMSKTYFPCATSVILLRRLISSHVGYILLTLTRPRAGENRGVWEILKLGRRLLEENCEVDMTSCRLKMATFYYQVGKLHKCIQTVKNVLARYSGDTLPLCPDSHTALRYTAHPRKVRIMQKLLPHFDTIQVFLSHVAFPVVFSPLELLCVPPGLHELSSIGAPAFAAHPYMNNFVVVDPLVYSYYMLVISYHELGLRVECLRCLSCMRDVVRNPWNHILYYPEVAMHLFEFCNTLCSQ